MGRYTAKTLRSQRRELNERQKRLSFAKAQGCDPWTDPGFQVVVALCPVKVELTIKMEKR